MTKEEIDIFFHEEYKKRMTQPLGFLMDGPMSRKVKSMPPPDQKIPFETPPKLMAKYIFAEGQNYFCTFHPNDDSSNNPHSHDFFEIVYVYSGTVRNHVGEEVITLHTGDICILTVDTLHYLEQTPESIIVINFMIKKEFLDSIFFAMSSTDNVVFNFLFQCLYQTNEKPYLLFRNKTYDHDMVQPQLHMAIVESMRHGPLFTECMSHYFHLFCLELTRSHMEYQNRKINEKLDHEPIDQILSYIITNCQSVTLDSLADEFHYHPTYIPQMLKKYTGKTFTDIRQMARIQVVKDKLTRSSMDLESITTLVGYSSVGQLYQVFKKYTGMSPSQYKKSQRAPLV